MNRTLAYYVTLLRKNFTGYCNQKLAEEGLLQGQLYFILYIGRHTHCSPKELAQALHMDAGHTTRTITKLVQEGFLVQEKSKTDGRAHTLLLTEKGDAAFRMCHELFVQWDNKVLEPLSAEEQKTLMALLLKVTAAEGEMPCVRKDAGLAH